MKLPTRLRFADEKVQKAFTELESSTKDEQLLHGWLVRAFTDIEENAFCGIQIPKKLIPKEYVQKYELRNLWKYNLPNAWRLLYCVESQEIVVVSIVLEWLPHKEYEKRFNY